ncbi:DUF4136 domain-containing protein [Spirosoma sp. KUDC1026]|uniref:DUF4136 domain-containing protein n=1 Tax=Spirosoma sp. KUDC1026 TaxID=2745947 RepID=UPI00159BA183|nr:DUF4136 domain-containing protein [Spirosoma sp. KUDC1026]QKZ11314.1 DUF4136 domain-containing protein [Spirosoma sp. KUDC1026]
MKTVFFALALLLTATLTQAQQMTTDVDQATDVNFDKYKTYAWASQVDSKLDPGLYFLNDLELKKRIRDAVAFSLDGRGYKFTRNSPDLLVNFRVFDKPTKIEGYESYGVSYFGANEIREPEDKKTFEVPAGSVILNLVDTKSGQVIWRGISSGLTNTNGFDRDENKVKQAINLLFEKYSYRADKY